MTQITVPVSNWVLGTTPTRQLFQSTQQWHDTVRISLQNNEGQPTLNIWLDGVSEQTKTFCYDLNPLNTGSSLFQQMVIGGEYHAINGADLLLVKHTCC